MRAHVKIKKCADLGVGHVQPLFGVIFSRQVSDQVQSSQTRLSSAGDEDEDWFGRGVGADGLIGGFVHGGHAGTVVLAREASDVHLERHGTHRGAEIEQPHLVNAQPIGQIAGVGQRGGETHDANFTLRVGRDEVRARNDHFQDRTTILPCWERKSSIHICIR